VEQLFFKILNEPVDLAPLRQAECPESIVGLVEKCLAKNAANRPQDMSAVRREIERALEQERQPAAADGQTVQKRGGLIVAGVVVAALIVALTLFFALRKKEVIVRTPPAKVLSASISTPTGDMVLVKAATAPAFYIDRTEVTNDAYSRFCSERQRPLPPGFPQDRPDLPVVNITIVDAQEFAKWAGKRLPGKVEWEAAARGADGRAYPWGNAHDPLLANVADNPSLGSHILAPVQSFEQGASPYGALQMAGNAWEFVDELITPSKRALEAFAKLMTPPPAADEPWYTIRGGAFDVPLVQNATSEWSAVPARFRAPDIGFRCAKTPE
jgi:formylglycine-generating enzyme required for sulfatase activity